MSRTFENGGYQSWSGPWVCEGEHDTPGCRAGTDRHLHCDGPTAGDEVTYHRERDGVDGVGVVRIHWHYEGCMIDIDHEGMALCPELGDAVWEEKP